MNNNCITWGDFVSYVRTAKRDWFGFHEILGGKWRLHIYDGCSQVNIVMAVPHDEYGINYGNILIDHEARTIKPVQVVNGIADYCTAYDSPEFSFDDPINGSDQSWIKYIGFQQGPIVKEVLRDLLTPIVNSNK